MKETVSSPDRDKVKEAWRNSNELEDDILLSIFLKRMPLENHVIVPDDSCRQKSLKHQGMTVKKLNNFSKFKSVVC